MTDRKNIELTTGQPSGTPSGPSNSDYQEVVTVDADKGQDPKLLVGDDLLAHFNTEAAEEVDSTQPDRVKGAYRQFHNIFRGKTSGEITEETQRPKNIKQKAYTLFKNYADSHKCFTKISIKNLYNNIEKNEKEYYFEEWGKIVYLGKFVEKGVEKGEKAEFGGLYGQELYSQFDQQFIKFEEYTLYQDPKGWNNPTNVWENNPSCQTGAGKRKTRRNNKKMVKVKRKKTTRKRIRKNKSKKSRK
jgi:hypothetical protein